MTGSGSLDVLLASGSPQRREILDRLGIDFSVVEPAVEEIAHGEPEEVVLANALLKARARAREGALTIACDTEVALAGHLFGKPQDPLRAHEYLAQLSGRTHTVLSGLVVIGPDPEDVRTGVESTSVTFRDLPKEAIDAYVESGEWQGRAGGYAVQGLGSTLVRRIEGDLSNVIGLPVGLLIRLAPELEIGFEEEPPQ